MKNVYKLVLNSIVAISLSFIALYLMYKYLFPFALAIVLAILVEPMVSFIEKKMGFKRWIAVLLSIIFSFSFIFSVILIFSHQLINEIAIISKTEQFNNTFEAISNTVLIMTNKIFSFLPNELMINIQNQINYIGEYLIKELLKAKDHILNFLSLIPNFFLSIIITIVTTYFVSKDKEKISTFIKLVSPRKARKDTLAIISKIVNSLFVIIKTEIILVLLFTLLTIVGFSLLGIKYSILLGMLCGILDLIPIIGPGIIFIPWIVYGFFVQKNIIFTSALLCLFLCLIVLRQLVQAKLLSSNLGLHPVVFLIAIYTGVRFFGIIGIIITPFMFIIAKEIIKLNIHNNINN